MSTFNNEIRDWIYKEERNIYKERYKWEHREEERFYNKQYKKEHKDEIKQYHKQYNRQYVKDNPEKMRVNGHNRRALEKTAGKLTLQTLQMVYEDNIKKYGTLTCYLCLKPIKFKEDHLEHKTPLSRGGTNDYNNLGVSHDKCNKSKHDKTEAEYREWLTNSYLNNNISDSNNKEH